MYLIILDSNSDNLYIQIYLFNRFHSIKIHFTPMIDFYEDLRKHHANGSINVYPFMFLLIAFQIPCSLLNSRVSKRYFKKYSD